MRQAALYGVDWVKATTRLWEAVAFCAYYGKQRVDDVRHWPRSDVMRMSRFFEDFLRNENRVRRKK